jgi:hypothetical protein
MGIGSLCDEPSGQFIDPLFEVLVDAVCGRLVDKPSPPIDLNPVCLLDEGEAPHVESIDGPSTPGKITRGMGILDTAPQEHEILESGAEFGHLAFGEKIQ